MPTQPWLVATILSGLIAASALVAAVTGCDMDRCCREANGSFEWHKTCEPALGEVEVDANLCGAFPDGSWDAGANDRRGDVRPDAAPPDGQPADGRAGDGPRLDGRSGDGRGDAASSLCSGPAPAAARVAGQAVSVTEVRSGTTLTQCCTGEVFRLLGKGGDGQPLTLSLSLLRFPDLPRLPAHMDLAQLPPGVLMLVGCEPYEACGSLNPESSTFLGSADVALASGPPAYELTLCLSARPKAGADPATKPVEVWLARQLVNVACTFGIDQTCNLDPRVSSLHGKCNQNGTCTCEQGFEKDPASGKCRER